MLNDSRDKHEGTHRVGRGEESPLCDPGSELLLGKRARVAREKYTRREKNKQNVLAKLTCYNWL